MKEFIRAVNQFADISGEVIRKYFRKPIMVDDKSDASPVTIADKEVEEKIRSRIGELFPDHGIFGEEYGKSKIDARYVWVIDPIDGTKAFISGKPSFGTLIALLEDGYPILGVIDQPITQERWLGAKGQDSLWNGQKIGVRKCDNLAKATLYATAPEMFVGEDYQDFLRLYSSVKLPRYGADCYAYGLLAMGFVDLVVEASLKPYDYCSLVPIIEGAGGKITDWQGNKLGLDSDGRVIAAGDAALHALALAKLGEK